MRIILVVSLLASYCHAGDVVGIFQPTGRYVTKTVTKTVTVVQRGKYAEIVSYKIKLTDEE